MMGALARRHEWEHYRVAKVSVGYSYQVVEYSGWFGNPLGSQDLSYIPAPLEWGISCRWYSCGCLRLADTPSGYSRSSVSGSLNNRGNWTNYWSSSQNNASNAWNVNVNNSNVNGNNANYQHYGFPVRVFARRNPLLPCLELPMLNIITQVAL